MPATCKRKGGSETGPSPVDRARNGSKHHLLVDATGVPLAWTLTGGNRRRKTEHGSGAGRHRWVVERTFAWLHQKRLHVRYDRRHEIHEAPRQEHASAPL